MRLLDLPTPAAVVLLDAVERNTARMAARADALGVRLRPHVKTHKCLPAARLQVRGHFGGITVSTLAEARHFAAGGFGDITYAVPLAPEKAALIPALADGVRRLGVIVDSDAGIDALEAEHTASGHVFAVQLKVDCGAGRAGVDPDGDDLLRLGRRLAASPAVAFEGLLAHGGQTYAAASRDELFAAAREERDRTLAAAARLRGDGVEVREVSVGSTPGMSVIDALGGVTEVRPGNYVFFDDDQLWLGACAAEDRGFAVLATVIGSYPARGTAVIDAGALALSKDPGPAHVPGFPGGYGSLADADSGRPLAGLRLVSLSQEHGVVHIATAPGGESAPPRVGERVLVFPNHSCLAAACFDTYHVVQDGAVVDRWSPVRGW